MVILLFKMAEGHHVPEVSLGTKKAAVMCPTEKIFDNFRSGTSHSHSAPMFNVNESALHIK